MSGRGTIVRTDAEIHCPVIDEELRRRGFELVLLPGHVSEAELSSRQVEEEQSHHERRPGHGQKVELNHQKDAGHRAHDETRAACRLVTAAGRDRGWTPASRA